MTHPPKCVRCGQFIGYQEFMENKVKTISNYYGFGGLDIYFKHSYNCKENESKKENS